MREFEEKLKNYIEVNNIDAEQLVFTEDCHSVEAAAKAVNVTPEDFVKNICLFSEDGTLVVAIVKGEDKVSTKKAAKALQFSFLRVAAPDEILEKIGYPCGGVPSFGYNAEFLVDERVLEMNVVYTGGGSPNSLVRVTPKALLEANKGRIVKIRK